MTVTLDMLGPAHGGSTVARLDGTDGRVVFVRGALPGETGVPVELDTDPETSRKRFLSGSVVDSAAIAGPSAHRVAPQCPAAARGAGCCDLDIIDAEGSVELKTRVVLDQFARIGRIDLDDAGVPVRQLSPAPFTGYRTRVRLGVDESGQAGLRLRASNGIVPVTEVGCAQWAPALADGLAETLAEAELTPGAEVCVALGEDGLRGIVEVPAARASNPRSRSGRRRAEALGHGPRRHLPAGSAPTRVCPWRLWAPSATSSMPDASATSGSERSDQSYSSGGGDSTIGDLQIEYSLLSRGIEENGILAACRELGIGVTAYGALAKVCLQVPWEGLARCSRASRGTT